MSDPYRPGNGLQSWATTLPPTICAGEPISGHGSPEGVVAGPAGLLYTDIDTNDLYRKMRGTSELGWQKIGAVPVPSSGGGGSGTGNVVAWDGTGAMPTVTGPGWCIGEIGSAVEGQLWKKTSAGSGNDWVGV